MKSALAQAALPDPALAAPEPGWGVLPSSPRSTEPAWLHRKRIPPFLLPLRPPFMLRRSLANPGGITRQGKQEVKTLWGPFQSKRQSNREAKTDALLKIKSGLQNSQREAKKWKYCTVPGNWEHPVLINSYNSCVYNNITAAFWNDAKNYVCYLKDKFEMVQKGDRAAEYDVMKALSLKIYIFTIYFQSETRRTDKTSHPGTGTSNYLNDLSTNRARDTKTKP